MDEVSLLPLLYFPIFGVFMDCLPMSPRAYCFGESPGFKGALVMPASFGSLSTAAAGREDVAFVPFKVSSTLLEFCSAQLRLC